ncbi:MAG: cytochrome c oxidase subunit II [Chloroflexi bacterium]|nr:cytochrome c oxidase subunit II [Chloroflexota bacterium]
MKKDLIIAVILWFVFTAVGEYWAFTANMFPIAAAEEAVFLDDAFRLLIILGMPVFTLVLTFLFFSIFHYRSKGDPDSDGPPMRTNTPLAAGWLAVTTGLAIFVVFNPGLKGIAELEANPNADLVIQVTGEQWHWDVSYPQYDLAYQRATQIALPADTRVKFELTSTDVIHSLWIPAFRLKMDAVPGKDTSFYVTPTEIVDTEMNSNVRVQCAELCGTGHARMQMAVRIMEPDEFEAWVAEAKAMTMSDDMEGMDMGSSSDNMDSEGDNMDGMDSGADDMDMDTDSGMDMDSGDSDMDMDSGSDDMNMNSDSDG